MPPIPYNERYRLDALYACDILDTQAEPAFDRITQLAARHFGVPVALVSLVDSVRQWFKSRVGLKRLETSREESFCAHAIMSHEIMQVPDATKDPRFADNPLVTHEPWIRFYAGAPLVLPQGFCLGTLCLIDHQPRDPLTTQEQSTLRDLADLVIRELMFRKICTQTAEVLKTPSREQGGHRKAVSGEPSAAERELAQEAQLDVLVSLAHELRTPLNAILGFSECINKQMFGPVENAKYLEYSRYIYNSGNHILGIAKSILDLNAIKRGQISLQEEVIDIVELLRQTTGMFVEQARQSGIIVANELLGDEPALLADRQQVMQMLVNLIGNSVKFTPKGGSVSVTCRLDGNGMLILSVADTGIGIAPGDIDRALMDFGRIDTCATREGKGTGLGLSITKRLIELHGGGLTIASSVGVGTAVDLRFPAYRVVPKLASGNEPARTPAEWLAGPAA
jgi:signal transduction histidine kinase